MFRQRRRAARDEAARASATDPGRAGAQGGFDAGAGPDFGYDQDDHGRPGQPVRPEGPWDVSEVDNPHTGRFDLGALLVPEVPGMELQVEVVDQRIISATGVLADSELKLQAFAAPRTEGIWDEVRGEIKGAISKQGGTVDEVDGPLGWELRARVPGRTPDGKSTVQPARFFGVDGPRWFLHATLTGRGAREPQQAGPVEDLLRGVVVVRGDAAMPPRELIPLRLPEDAETAADEAAEDEGGTKPSLDPFRRGPEITEVR